MSSGAIRAWEARGGSRLRVGCAVCEVVALLNIEWAILPLFGYAFGWGLWLLGWRRDDIAVNISCSAVYKRTSRSLDYLTSSTILSSENSVSAALRQRSQYSVVPVCCLLRHHSSLEQRSRDRQESRNAPSSSALMAKKVSGNAESIHTDCTNASSHSHSDSILGFS